MQLAVGGHRDAVELGNRGFKRRGSAADQPHGVGIEWLDVRELIEEVIGRRRRG
jgi:hypothetical protein